LHSSVENRGTMFLINKNQWVNLSANYTIAEYTVTIERAQI
jgi:hypothetical protein